MAANKANTRIFHAAIAAAAAPHDALFASGQRPVPTRPPSGCVLLISVMEEEMKKQLLLLLPQCKNANLMFLPYLTQLARPKTLRVHYMPECLTDECGKISYAGSDDRFHALEDQQIAVCHPSPCYARRSGPRGGGDHARAHAVRRQHGVRGVREGIKGHAERPEALTSAEKNRYDDASGMYVTHPECVYAKSCFFGRWYN